MFKEQRIDQEVCTQKQSLLRGISVIWELEFNIACFKECITERCLGNLEHFANIRGISICRCSCCIYSPWKHQAAVWTADIFGAKVNAHTTAACWRFDNIESFVFIVVNLELWNAITKKNKPAGEIRYGTERIHGNSVFKSLLHTNTRKILEFHQCHHPH
jgi:hypothetical protein